MVFHGQTITHIDALSHYSYDGLMYNGVPAAVVTSREGAQSHAIDLTAQGLVTRGVLLDIPKVRGVDWLPPDAPVMPEDLDAAERDHGVTVEPGDILLVRTGNYRRRIQEGPIPGTEPSVACHVACAPWFKERGIAMLGTDTSNDIRPNEYGNIVSPLHIACLVYLGVWLIDNANLEEAAEAAARHNRYEFMLSIGPLRLRHVTGSPVNPIAIF
jgi:kynurenine formamidase